MIRGWQHGDDRGRSLDQDRDLHAAYLITSGQRKADGIIRYWYHGALRFAFSNVLFRPAQHPSMYFNQFMLAPYIGIGSPANQSV